MKYLKTLDGEHYLADTDGNLVNVRHITALDVSWDGGRGHIVTAGLRGYDGRRSQLTGPAGEAETGRVLADIAAELATVRDLYPVWYKVSPVTESKAPERTLRQQVADLHKSAEAEADERRDANDGEYLAGRADGIKETLDLIPQDGAR